MKTGSAAGNLGRNQSRSSLDFQTEIESDPETAADLSSLRRILEMQRPWDEFDRMDDIIARIKPVYERIRDEKFSRLQHDTLLQINRMIETISELLENVHARDDIRNMALVELQKIKNAIAVRQAWQPYFQTSGKLPKKHSKKHRISCFLRAEFTPYFPSKSKSFSPLQRRSFLLSYSFQ